jgi:hypothetical protein
MSNSNERKLGWKIADLVAKLLIPVAVAYFAWVQNDAAIRSERTHQEVASELKLLEIAWTSLMSEDPAKKNLALDLLRTMQPELAGNLMSVFSQDETQPPEIRMRASQIMTDITGLLLRSYKIDIYYQDDIPEAEYSARYVESIVTDSKLTSRITLAARSHSFFTKVTLPVGNEVRYDSESELEAAQALAALINSNDISLNFRVRPVRVRRTPGILSVFIWTRIQIEDGEIDTRHDALGH